MKRIFKTISRKGSTNRELTQDSVSSDDSPEANIARGVKLFCESGGPNNSGEEVLHLPVIVDSAESSPAAAQEAAHRIRKFLSKDNLQRAYVQYNAIMLVRILADNPGKSFTKNLDAKFAATVKELLRDGRDMSVQQILRETLESFETQKSEDETLAPLREMWKKEKQRMEKWGGAPTPGAVYTPPAPHPNQQNYFARSHGPHGLPPPHELAQRIEEARTSSKLLLQVVQSTPPYEVIGNELVKEFVERCQSASRSIQGYIHSTNPPPDEDTLLTLIETNDQLSTAISRHQRALLQGWRLNSAANNATANNATANNATVNNATANNATANNATAPPAPTGGLFEAPGSQPRGVPLKSFSPPPQKISSSQPQDPFDDGHETDASRMDRMQAPLEPQYHGVSASFRQQQNGSYYNNNLSGAGSESAWGVEGQRSFSSWNRTPHGVTATNNPVSPEEVRKPVQYRF